ncbi:MAG: 4Fe-4S dicluster domain-containing protein, partial [Clostridiales bacterium]|nr:4Fe-4S dicluster domain-containing protein [Clostridiales bacterium]
WAYHKAAVLCCELAAFIRESGYSASGHHHRRDYVIHVPIAIDAGLGQLGRNGYLLTPEWGPCCRITTVTTEMPLIPDKPVDYGMDYFCKICKKCAHNCPSRAVPQGDKEEVRGFVKYHIDPDKCFKFWLSKPDRWFGCAICMKTCPWNRKNTWYHQLSVKMAAKSKLFCHLLLLADDLIRGKHPKFKYDWIDYKILDRDVAAINAQGGSKDAVSKVS